MCCPAPDPRAQGRGRSRHRVSSPRVDERVSSACRTIAPAKRRRSVTRSSPRSEPAKQRGARLADGPRCVDVAVRVRSGDRALHHRVNDAGAVLGAVNALRVAPTRPVAGPAGIDHACARLRSANTRWWRVVAGHGICGAVHSAQSAPGRRTTLRCCCTCCTLSRCTLRLTTASRGRNVRLSRQCDRALLWFAIMASRARIPPAPPGHGSERTFTTPQSVAGRSVRAQQAARQGSSLRVVPRTTRSREAAFTAGAITP